MIKELPFIRINKDSKISTSKIENFFYSQATREYLYHIEYNHESLNPIAEFDIDIFYSENNQDFISKKVQEISTIAKKINPVLFLCNRYPENLSLLSNRNDLIYDIVLMPASPHFIQNKIDQLLRLSESKFFCEKNKDKQKNEKSVLVEKKMQLKKPDAIENTEKLLTIQHKIEYYDWYQHKFAKSLKFLLVALMEIEWMDGGGVYLFEKKTGDLVLASNIGLSDEFIDQNKRFQDNSSQVLFLRKKKNFFGEYNDLANNTEHLSNVEQLKAIAIIPLIHLDEVIGCINLASKSKETIPQYDRIALESIASKISTIVSYSKARHELEQSKIDLEKVVKKRTKKLELINQKLKKEINTHKETQEALSYSENLYYSIFNNANDGIVLYDINTLQALDLNSMAHKDLGYTKKELLKLKSNIYTVYESENYRKIILKKLFKEKHIEYNVKHITKSNQIKYRTVSANIVKINKREFILAIFHDITELKIKEFELQASEEKYKELQSSISIGMFMTSLEGEILYANKAMTELLGYKSEDEVRKIPVVEFYHDKNKRTEIVEILKDQGYVNKVEILVTRKDKTTFWGSLSLKSSKINDSNTMRISGILEDISDKKQTQLNLEKAHREIQLTNQNLEKKIDEALKDQQKQQQYLIQKSKLESLGELAAGIAHEINQPLGIMSLIFENLQSRFNAEKITKEYLDTKINAIIGNIDRIKEIIDHIRIFSRERDTIVLEKLDVNRVILNVHKLIGTQYQNHNIKIIHELHENPGFTVGSKLKLEQILLNLLSNAKYALEENEISQDENYTKTIKIKTSVDNNRICLLFEDNGNGIESANLPKLFDPFYTTKPEWVGTGLGLSIVYGIIKEMHGEIEVTSKPNNYTRFKIYLPRFPENV